MCKWPHKMATTHNAPKRVKFTVKGLKLVIRKTNKLQSYAREIEKLLLEINEAISKIEIV